MQSCKWFLIALFGLLVIFCFGCLNITAQETGEDIVKSITAVRINENVKIDGVLDEPFWQRVPCSGDFIQFQPDEGKPASESTFVRVVYDDEAIYVGLEMYDSHPEKIIKRLTRRDRGIEADCINVIIDSHHDHQTAYAFCLYVSGTQKDGCYYNDNQGDESWDAIWESSTKITNSGWTAEMKIPFSCLRYACQDDPVWGFYVSRDISRKNELDRWVHIPEKANGFVSYFGHFKGLKNLKPAKSLEILPYVVSYGQSEEKSQGNPDGRNFFGNTGFDLKYGITSDITLNATVNPDFGQVEADQTILNLSAFETQYPEKRPFFLEGEAIFNTPFDLFYSRRIGKQPSGRIEDADYFINIPNSTTILAAGKVSGKTKSGTSIGILEAMTQKEKAEFVDTLGHRRKEVVEPEANYFVARFMQDIWKNSYVGMMATAVNQKDFTPAYTGGVDWILRFHKGDYQYSGQMIGSRTGLSKNGWGGWMSIQKEGGERILGSLQVDYLDRALDLNRIGFLNRANVKEISGWMQYRTTKKRWIVRKSWHNLNVSFTDNLSGVELTRGGNYNNELELTNFWYVGGGAWMDFQKTYSDMETRGGPPTPIPIGQSWWFWFNTDSRKWWQINPSVEGGDNWDGHYNSYSLWLNLQPRPNLEISFAPGYSHSRGESRWLTNMEEDGKRIDIFGEQEVKRFDFTVRGTFTFSRNLTLQVYAQPFMAAVNYKNFKKLVPPNGFEYVDSTVYNENNYQPDYNWTSFNSNLVLRWEYRPGSTLFLVWTQSRGNFNNIGDFKFKRDWDNLFNTIPGNTFLIKINYWYNI